MKSWHELKDVQLPLTYGELLAIYKSIDRELMTECNKYIKARKEDVAECIQSNRNAIVNMLCEIKMAATIKDSEHGKETLLGEPE